jgi:hypothetical protein
MEVECQASSENTGTTKKKKACEIKNLVLWSSINVWMKIEFL